MLCDLERAVKIANSFIEVMKSAEQSQLIKWIFEFFGELEAPLKREAGLLAIALGEHQRKAEGRLKFQFAVCPASLVIERRNRPIGRGESQTEADQKALEKLNAADAATNELIVYRYFSYGADSTVHPRPNRRVKCAG